MLDNNEKIENHEQRWVETPLEIESKKYARAKLDKLTDLQGFGIRFINKGEYETIMKSGQFNRAEVTVFENKKDLNFQEYLADCKTYTNNPYLWADRIQRQTRWPDSKMNVTTYATLMHVLRQAHKEARAVEKNLKDQNIRKETMRVFREYLMGERNWDIQTGRMGDYSIYTPMERLQKFIDTRINKRSKKLKITENDIYNATILS